MRKLCVGLVALLLLTACGEGGPFEGFGLSSLAGGGGNTWEDRFADLPAPDWDTQVNVIAWDQERALAVADVEPDDREGFAQVTMTGPMAPTIPEVLDPTTWVIDGFREGNGYDRSDVAWAVEVYSPPVLAATLGGDFDLAELEAVNGPADDGVIVSENPMEAAIEDRVPGRPLGRQPHYHLDGDRLHVTRSSQYPTDDLPRAIERSSLADLVRVIDDLDAYAAYALLAQEGVGSFRSLDGQLPDELRATSALPLPYLGVGVAFPEPDDDGVPAAMLFFHRSEDVAEANAEALVEVLAEGEAIGMGIPWSDLVTDVEVVQDERVVVANVRLTGDARPHTLLGQMNRLGLVPSDS